MGWFFFYRPPHLTTPSPHFKNCRDLVPIYRIRRTIGARVSRRQFNDYLLEMQGDDIFQLKEGSVEDSALDKIEDSVSTELDGLRCFASLM